MTGTFPSTVTRTGDIGHVNAFASSIRNTNTPRASERESSRPPARASACARRNPLRLKIDFLIFACSTEREEAVRLVQRCHNIASLQRHILARVLITVSNGSDATVPPRVTCKVTLSIGCRTPPAFARASRRRSPRADKGIRLLVLTSPTTVT